MEAIPDRQYHVVLLRRREHGVGFRHRARHRFFADHVFTGIGSANRKMRVQTVRHHDVNDIDIGILRDLVEVVVVVDVLVLDPVFVLPHRNLFRAAGDNASQLGDLSLLQRRREMVGRVIPEADQSHAQATSRVGLLPPK